MHAPSVPGQEWPTPNAGEPNPWLRHLSRGMWLRGHISVFAVGSVILLAANLLRGSGGIWADTAISAWAVLLVAHGILMIIARLMQELLADDEEGEIRPASEMHWHTPSTWTIPSRARGGTNGSGGAAPTPAPEPTLDPQASAAAAAARERRQRATTPPPEPDATERVSWQAATDAAWLAPRPDQASPKPGAPERTPDDDDDFTPLKFD